MNTTYSYKTKDGVVKEISIKEDIANQSKQALKDYETSYKYIQSQYFYIWRYALKAYHLSTYDRKTKIKSWQSNIALGIIRSFVDVLISVVNERPLTFIGTPINQKGLENKENILKTLNYISDVTRFHTQIKQCLRDGLIFGMIALRVGYLKKETKTEITSIINGDAKNVVVEQNEDMVVMDTPYAKSISVFNIFPDPYSGNLRYVTERGVMSHFEFKKIFLDLIKNKNNRSPLNTDEFINALPVNAQNADLLDYGAIINQIHTKANDELREEDKYGLQKQFNRYDTITDGTPDEDSDVTEGLLEYKYTVYDDRIILHVNDYPVYIGPNIYGFINYVIKASGDNNARCGEGIPYMLKGLEEVGTAFVNNYFDGARALAAPTFVAAKNLLINEKQVTSGQPGGVIWTEGSSTNGVITRLDKGGLNDFNIQSIIMGIAQQITGISEYNLGQSAGERTASGALAVTQSSNKRIAPYISTFTDAMSIVAQMWLALVKKYWVKENYIYVFDEQGNQLFEAMQNKNLIGGLNISLQSEGLLGVTNELELNKLISIWNTLAQSGTIKSGEIATEIIKKAGFSPSRFVINPDQVKPDAPVKAAIPTQLENPEASMGDILQEAANPQIDMGNGGKGQA